MAGRSALLPAGHSEIPPCPSALRLPGFGHRWHLRMSCVVLWGLTHCSSPSFREFCLLMSLLLESCPAASKAVASVVMASCPAPPVVDVGVTKNTHERVCAFEAAVASGEPLGLWVVSYPKPKAKEVEVMTLVSALMLAAACSGLFSGHGYRHPTTWSTICFAGSAFCFMTATIMASAILMIFRMHDEIELPGLKTGLGVLWHAPKLQCIVGYTLLVGGATLRVHPSLDVGGALSLVPTHAMWERLSVCVALMSLVTCLTLFYTCKLRPPRSRR